MTRATIVGAGGLGGAVAISLGSAGLELTIVDPASVELSGLHRQLQATTVDIGASKAAVLAGAVVARGGQARAIQQRFTRESADELAGACDLIVDATDHAPTSFVVSDWAVATGRSYVVASAVHFGGHALVGAAGSACYRCLFEKPTQADAPAVAGILGPLTGAIGGVAAALALGLARRDRSYAGSIFVFDDIRHSTEPRVVRFGPRPGCEAAGSPHHA